MTATRRVIMASSEISSSVLRCNACWKSVTAGKAYKT